MSDIYIVYCDGNGYGDVAVRLQYAEKIKDFVSRSEAQSHNQAEAYAILYALGKLPSGSIAEIRSDSQLIIYGLTGKYDITNVPLKEIITKIHDEIRKRNINVQFRWIPGDENPADAIIRTKRGN